jgi:transcriptional regulator with XRE-family HTH domain
MNTVSPIRVRLKETRESRSLTQVELARLSGIGQPTISNIENGKTSGIDFQVLERLADALGVNAAVLIEHILVKPKRKRG